MNIEKIKEEIETQRYDKYKFLYFTGKKKLFVKLVNQLPGCQITSIRDMLVKHCQKNEILNLNKMEVSLLAKELLPKPKQGESVALIDIELFLKYDIFTTTLRNQDFQNKQYLIHIPSIYSNLLKNEQMRILGE